MRLRIHRGAKEIGGSCVELEAQGRSILLDLGLPLDAPEPDLSLMPPVSGLTDASNPNLLGVVLSHTHGDHNGLTGLVHSTLPVFMGAQAQTLLLASRPFVRRTPLPLTIRTYADKIAFDLGPFRITPFLTDHSAFDAYDLLVEADGKRVFYSGDLRAHGRKARLVERLMARPPLGIDLLLLEGTTLSRSSDAAAEPETERNLEERIFEQMKGSSGLILAVFSPQNIDRFVTIVRATLRAGRMFIADVYLAYLLDQLNLSSLPRAGRRGFRVYLPDRQKWRIVADKAFDLVSRYRTSRIYRDEIAANPHRWVMLFRESMMMEMDRMLGSAGTTLIYSLWPGYLDRAENGLRSWCKKQGIELKVCHTSGHADPQTLARFASALQPRVSIPIHTNAPHIFERLIPNTLILNDGIWFGL
jgi:ribonuclease J